MSTDRVVLEGGVASDVAVVREPGGREFVIKKALPKLKVAADWRCDPARSSIEVEALRVAPALLGAHVVPQVLWVDAANHCFAMEKVDAGVENWQTQLSAGHVDLWTATRAGELLARLHVRSAQRLDLAERFAGRDFFEQLRIEPFFVRSAQRNPHVHEPIQRVIESLRAPGRALVHGDYSPKNILARGAHVVILDWEVAHWGDPRFDVAFCLSHLLLTGWLPSSDQSAFREAGLAFVAAYEQQTLTSLDDADLGALLGCLVLARVDGDSPVNFLNELNAQQVRSNALSLLSPSPRSLSDVFTSLLV